MFKGGGSCWPPTWFAVTMPAMPGSSYIQVSQVGVFRFLGNNIGFPCFSSLRVLGVVARAFPLEGGSESPELYHLAAANRKPSFTSILSDTTVAIACIICKATSSGRIPHSPRSRRPLLQLSAAGHRQRPIWESSRSKVENNPMQS